MSCSLSLSSTHHIRPILVFLLLLTLVATLNSSVQAATVWNDDFNSNTGWAMDADWSATSVTFGGTLHVRNTNPTMIGAVIGRDISSVTSSFGAYWRISSRFRYRMFTGYGNAALAVGSTAFYGRNANEPGYTNIVYAQGRNYASWVPDSGFRIFIFDTLCVHDLTDNLDWWTLTLNVDGVTWNATIQNPTAGTFTCSGVTPANRLPRSVSFGDHTVQPYAGFFSEFENDSVRMETDAEPPTTTVTLSGTAGVGGWYHSAVTAEVNGTDAWSGVQSLEYRLDGGAPTPYSSPLTISGEGTHTISHRAVDYAGNSSAWVTDTFGIDMVAPSTTASFRGAQMGVWFTEPPVMTLTATDATSGVAVTMYQIDGGAPQLYTGPTTISTEGVLAITFSSIDSAGNVEDPPGTATLWVDTTPPMVSAVYTGTTGAAGWYRSAVTAQLTAQDATSGVALLEYNLDGLGWVTYVGDIPLTGDGIHTLAYRATDNAGHEAAYTDTIRIDTTAPTTSLTVSGATLHNGWYDAVPTISLAGSDATSGIAQIDYQVDGGTFQPYNAPFQVTSSGTHVISYRSTDAAGNVEPLQVSILYIDLAAPTSMVTLGGTLGDNNWYISPVTAEFDANDTDSGVERIEYSLDGALWQVFGDPLTVTGDGAHVLQYRAIDTAGHTENVHIERFQVDTTPPVITPSLTGTAGRNNWFVSPVTLALAADDLTSGTARLEYDDGHGFVPYTMPLIYTIDGVYTVTYRAADQAGNVSSDNVTVQVDTAPPVLSSLNCPGTVTPGGFTLFPTVSDTPSGVANWQLTVHTAEGRTGTTSGTGTVVTGNTLDNSSHSLSMIFWDGAGNQVSAVDACVVTVSLEAPPTQIPPPTATPTLTLTPRPTFTPTRTPTATASRTPRPTGTASSTMTASPTSTATVTPTLTNTATDTHTPTFAASFTPHPTQTTPPGLTVTPAGTGTFAASSTPPVTGTMTGAVVTPTPALAVMAPADISPTPGELIGATPAKSTSQDNSLTDALLAALLITGAAAQGINALLAARRREEEQLANANAAIHAQQQQLLDTIASAIEQEKQEAIRLKPILQERMKQTVSAMLLTVVATLGVGVCVFLLNHPQYSTYLADPCTTIRVAANTGPSSIPASHPGMWAGIAGLFFPVALKIRPGRKEVLFALCFIAVLLSSCGGHPTPTPTPTPAPTRTRIPPQNTVIVPQQTSVATQIGREGTFCVSFTVERTNNPLTVRFVPHVIQENMPPGSYIASYRWTIDGMDRMAGVNDPRAIRYGFGEFGLHEATLTVTLAMHDGSRITQPAPYTAWFILDEPVPPTSTPRPTNTFIPTATPFRTGVCRIQLINRNFLAYTDPSLSGNGITIPVNTELEVFERFYPGSTTVSVEYINQMYWIDSSSDVTPMRGNCDALPAIPPAVNLANMERKVLILTIMQESRGFSDPERDIIVHTMFNRLRFPNSYGSSFTDMVIGRQQYAVGAFNADYSGPNWWPLSPADREWVVNSAYDHWKTVDPTNLSDAENYVNRYMALNPPDMTGGAIQFVHSPEAAEIARRIQNCLGQAGVEALISGAGADPIINGDHMIVGSFGQTVYINMNYTPPLDADVLPNCP